MGEGQDKKPTKWGEDEHGPYRIDDKVWTMNEIRDHPMFMEDVPSDISDNPDLLALQSLLYDGQSEEEMAEHFRKLGNEAFRVSTNKTSSQNALMAYTKGLEMECKDNVLNSQLHSNRAAVSMRLKEYDKAVDDCRKAIKLDPKNTKAYYRGTKASEALGLTAQAVRFCKGALDLRPDDELRQMHKKLQQRLQQEEEQQRSRKAAEDLASTEYRVAKSAVQDLLEARGVDLGPILFEVAMYFQGKQPMPSLADDADDAVQWPLLLLYDETSQSDFVEIFDERCTLQEQFEIMFPRDRRVDWDEEGKYVWDRLVAYLEYYHGDNNRSTRMLRVDSTLPLQDALQNLRVPQCLTLHVLVDSSGAHESFCREHHLPTR